MATQQQVADHLDLSQPSIAGLVALRVFQSAGRAGLNIDDCRLAYIRHLREIAGGRTGDGTLTAERIRLTMAQADKVEMANAQRRGEVLEITPIVQLFSERAATVRSQLLAVPSSVAPAAARCRTVKETCAVIESAVIDALEALCADPEAIRATITKNAPQPSGDNEDEHYPDADEAALAPNSGRRSPAAKPRRKGAG